MCGICGAVALTPPADKETLQAFTSHMLNALAHRGPHGSHIIARPNAIFGANRLAIRDLGDGRQPLADETSGTLAVCNGEIDNHRELRAWLHKRGRFITQASDVAGIPALYLETGTAFVEHLAGVFALAVWDPQKQRLILARDRAGERHLYYTTHRGSVYFATELAALKAGLPHPLPLDVSAAGSYLMAGFYPAPQTPYSGIHKLRPGEIVTFRQHDIQHRRYWRNPLGTSPKRTATTPAFDPIFRNAVFRQTEIDVDYGVLLSGGVDSALVAAVARSVRPAKRPITYTIRFSETSFDEGAQAATVARSLGCECVPVTVSARDFPVALRELIETTGEPLADPAWIPLTLVARRAARDVRMVLAGEGADELFGGYPAYLGARLGGCYARLPEPVKTKFHKLIEHLPVSDKKVAVSFLLKRFVQGQDLSGLARHTLWTAHIPPDLQRRLGLAPPAFPQSHTTMDLLDQVQRYDFEHPLPEALMSKADHGGMRYALELRTPFLDQAVIEFAATLPATQRVRGCTTKAFLKRYARHYLPASVVNRRKRGLSVPLTAWLRGPLRQWAEARLGSNLLGEVGVSNATAVELLSEHRARVRDHSRALWTLIVLSEWLEWAAEQPQKQDLRRQSAASF